MDKKKLLEITRRVENLGSTEPLSDDEIKRLQNKLGVNFSEEFKTLSQKASYEFFGGFDFYNFGLEGNASVIGETLAARSKAKLSDNTLLLYEDDASLMLMQLNTAAPYKEKVFWINISDYENFCRGQKLKYKHNIFESFLDFFDFLLSQEEKERGLVVQK